MLPMQQQPFNNNNNNNYASNNSSNTSNFAPSQPTAAWANTGAILHSQQPNQVQAPLSLALGQDESLLSMGPRWNSYGLDSLPVNVVLSNSGRVSRSMDDTLPRTVPVYNHQPHPSMVHHRQYLPQSQTLQDNGANNILAQQQQQQQQQQQHPHQLYPQHIQMQQQSISQDIFANDYLFDAPSPVPTMSSLDLGISPGSQLHASPSPLHIPEYSQSPDMPIKNSPVDNQPAWGKLSPPPLYP